MIDPAFLHIKQVHWSDNICTDSHSTIHGTFTVHELEQLSAYCPEGSFTPTFSSNRHLKNIATIKHCLLNNNRYSFYFDFKANRNGLKLLLALGLNDDVLRFMAKYSKYMDEE